MQVAKGAFFIKVYADWCTRTWRHVRTLAESRTTSFAWDVNPNAESAGGGGRQNRLQAHGASLGATGAGARGRRDFRGQRECPTLAVCGSVVMRRREHGDPHEHYTHSAGSGGAAAQVNGPNQKALLSRLQVKGYPTLLLLRDGKTYEYSGQRTLAPLAAFAREGYKTAEAWPFHKAPNSVVGRLFGQATSLPVVLESTYKGLRETHSDTTIIAAVLCVPVVFGLACICFIDVLSTRRPSAAPRPHAA